MPTAPMLPPEAMAQAQATAGVNPTNFLIAAADMHSQGQLKSVVPSGTPLQTGKRPPRKIKVVK